VAADEEMNRAAPHATDSLSIYTYIYIYIYMYIPSGLRPDRRATFLGRQQNQRTLKNPTTLLNPSATSKSSMPTYMCVYIYIYIYIYIYKTKPIQV